MLIIVPFVFAWLGLVAAVTLDDFTPRVSNLSSACESLYTSQINGCEPNDFTSGSCSTDCVSALNALVASVVSACANQGISGENVINAFIDGTGVTDLCPNAASTSASTAAAASSAATTTSEESAALAIIASSTMTLSSTYLTTTGLLVDTTSMTTSIVATPSTTSAKSIAGTVTEVENTSSTTASTVIAQTTMTVLPQESTSSSSVASTDSTAILIATASSTTSTEYSQATAGGSGSPFNEYTSGAERIDCTIALLVAMTFAVLVYQ